LALKETTPYDACPYCLTEIVPEKVVSSPKGVQESNLEETRVEEMSMPTIEGKPTQMQPQTKKCEHQFGYLSKRSAKEKIPEECITCESIVQCMLMNVNG